MASSPQGALIVRTYKETPYDEVKWRDPSGTQSKKRLGKAWLDRGPGGGGYPLADLASPPPTGLREPQPGPGHSQRFDRPRLNLPDALSSQTKVASDFV